MRDPQIGAILAAAGAELVESSPDMEIGPAEDLKGDADYALVEVRVREPKDRLRLLRAGRRMAGAALVRSRVERVRSALHRCGYPNVTALAWERGLTMHPSPGDGVAHRRLIDWLPIDTILLGGKHRATKTVFAAALEEAEAAVGKRLEPEGLVFGASGVVFARTADEMIRVGIGPPARRIEEQEAALYALHAAEPPPVVADRVPWILACGRTGLAVWSVERRLRGSTPLRRLGEPLVSQSLDFLTTLYACRRSSGGSAFATPYAELITTLLATNSADDLIELARIMDRLLAGLPRGFGHGDFWVGNLLADEEGLVGVVDWPAAGPGHLPLIDVLHLEAGSIRELSHRSLGSVVVDDLLPQARRGGSELVRIYCRQAGLDLGPEELQALVVAYWLQEIGRDLVDPDRDPDKTEEPGWVAMNVDSVLRAVIAAPRRATGSRRIADARDVGSRKPDLN